MYRWPLLAAIVLLAPGSLSAVGSASPDAMEWWTWAADARGDAFDPVDGRVDILSFDGAVRSNALNLRLRSADPSGWPVGERIPVVSTASFTVHAGDAATAIQFSYGAKPSLLHDGEQWPATEWGVAPDSKAWDYWLWVSLESLTGSQQPDSFELRDLELRVSKNLVIVDGRSDGDEATGADVDVTLRDDRYVATGALSVATWMTVEGPDYAGGASVALDASGRPHVAYYIYDGDRGVDPGLYLASVDLQGSPSGLLPGGEGHWEARKVADLAITRNGGRDDQMRTQLAFDGMAHILYTADPRTDATAGSPDSIRYARETPSGFVVEDPTPGAASAVGPENVPDLAVAQGRVVATIPVGGDTHVQERRDGAWHRLAILERAPNARVAIDAEGNVHVAFATQEEETPLFHASERDGFKPVRLGSGVKYGWDSPETDGSFALGVQGTQPFVLWDGRGSPGHEVVNAGSFESDQVLATLRDGVWWEEAVPLVPGHGNPQYTLRLGIDGHGRLHAAGGYGGTDGLAVRLAEGNWVYEEMDRYDVWDMVVGQDGREYFAYTEPHGGTTVALSVRDPGASAAAAEASRPGAGADGPTRPTPGFGVGALAACVVLAAVALRRR